LVKELVVELEEELELASNMLGKGLRECHMVDIVVECRRCRRPGRTEEGIDRVKLEQEAVFDRI
jgi:hypothetical protein